MYLDSQEEIPEFTPREEPDFGTTGFSPARKKNRANNRIFQYIENQQIGFRSHSKVNNGSQEMEQSSYLMSQESMTYSQFSQDFAERLGAMQVKSSQEDLEQHSGENSNSGNHSFMLPGLPRSMLSSRQPFSSGKSAAIPHHNTAMERERQIPLRPSLPNPFLSPDVPIANSERTAVSNLRHVWVRPFKERSRYLTDFEEAWPLGKGVGGTVTAARHRLDGSLYAIKKSRERLEGDRHLKLLMREAQALAAVQREGQAGSNHYNRHIIRYHSCWLEEAQDDDDDDDDDDHCRDKASNANSNSVRGRQLYLQLELCPLGSLDQLIANINPPARSLLATYSSNTSKGQYGPQQEAASVLSNNNGSGGGGGMMMDTNSISNSNCYSLSQPPPISQHQAMPPSSYSQPGHGQGMEGWQPLPVSEAAAWAILQAMAEALYFLHTKLGMVHLDIRPANILLTTLSSTTSTIATATATAYEGVDDSNSYASLRQRAETMIAAGQVQLRLADFGHCRKLDETTAMNEGESRYCPRELIDGDTSSLFLPAADIFSLGASILELRLGRPLGSSGEEGIAEWHGIRDGQLPEGWDTGCSREFSSLVMAMLSPDPLNRPSAEEVILSCNRHDHNHSRSMGRSISGGMDGSCSSCGEFKAC